ncbi:MULTISPECIES: hypothetical protein [Streptomyces]|uniref:Transposase n=3 Tax=Streptomyces TaxID=1883 RepID=A0ABD5JEK5_9ACTN|nr:MULTISPECIES: hypothetical protein [Streptomyces]MEE4586176.1 hypothetical protein [Streptomyces sp. DSM 41602]WTA81418.1 hypothetical protein OG751_16770 [Streptomyces antimycoticus]KUL46457.1 hypothetical protein ADL28_35120 [Streptomyces violaceusniger]QTI88515.1 hypothetical protein AS97_48185 [Streptomyces sp. AgN23]RSS38007.1 hypothetical protein EF902_31395 [Streptomyces sp. WAC05858]
MADRQPDRDERPKMTMRVYTMAHDGIRVTRRAIVAVLAGDKSDAYALGQAWPPCQCPRHRDHNNPDRFKRS